MIFALIPAAGKSTRMGRPKLSLPLGDKTVLERVISVLQEAGVDAILVITGPHVPELAAIAEQAGARAVPLADETADMRSTVELGLSRLEELFGPRPNDFWLLVPGDHPSLDASVVRELIDASRRCSDHSIFVPVYQGKRGHPVLLRWHHVSRIRSSPAGVGVNAYFRECGGETMEVPMLSAEILRDLDTPLDYKRFCEAFSRPKPQET